MPGLVRKVVILAAVEGLILQAHGAVEHHNALKIDYKSREVSTLAPSESIPKTGPRLEAHGLIGLLSIASYSYLISITQREQVAQIFGKPIFVITGVAFTPLSSQGEAIKAITEAINAPKKGDSSDHDSDTSDESDVEPLHEPATPGDPIDPGPTNDGEGERPLQERSASGTSIVQDVIANRAQYGQVASQWFSRKSWPQGRLGSPILSTKQQQSSGEVKTIPPPDSTSQRKATSGDLDKASQEAAVALIPKILNSTKLILTSRSFFFSYDIDLTHRLGTRTLEQLNYNKAAKVVPDLRYFWNKSLGAGFESSPNNSFLIPVLQGFVGQRSFVLKREHANATAIKELETTDLKTAESCETNPSSPDDSSQNFLLTLISRRSTKRSGLRYLRRGIDDQGDCANGVETEQILSSPTWESIKIRSFCQYRGSIPLYFSQTPYAFKPIPVLHQSPTKNQIAMKKHFEALEKEYGEVQAALLVDKHGPEVHIGEAYEAAVKEMNVSLKPAVDIHWFDFHAECRGMKFENVERLVHILQEKIDRFGETVLDNGVAIQTQRGMIRTNCMDCLDRTNVAQSAFGQYVLQRDLMESENYQIDLLHDEATQWFNTLWADNGDAISRQYAGTAALKGDFTRTRKRNYRGALNDLGLTLNRYYNNMVNDFFSQAVIDLLVGNVTSRVFEDFESNMMSADPGVSLAGVRDTAIETCTKIVVQADEDLIHGWTLMAPAQPNTLRTLPFEEAVVLLTDAAIYAIKFDWNSQKVASFEKVDLRSIVKIQYGTYITSTLSERQMAEALNVGLVIQYNPDRNSVMRVNTRSLQNVISNEQVPSGVDGGTGLMSWVTSRTSNHSEKSLRTLALKVIPAETGFSDSKDTPVATAERICDDIRRAVTGNSKDDEEAAAELVERGDIISLAEAKKRTGYLEQLGHSIKKLVWT